MKKLILFLLLLSTPAFAGDSLQDLSWDSAAGWFTARLRGLGAKFVPDTETGAFSVTFTGPCNSGSQSFAYSRTGKEVTLRVPSFTCTSTVATNFSASAALPSSLRPTAVQDAPIFINNGGVEPDALGFLRVTPAGDINIYRSASANDFSSSGGAGPIQLNVVHYILN